MKHIDLIAAKMEQARWERGIPVAELADEFVRLCMELGVGLGRFLPGPSREPGHPGGQAARTHN